MPVPPLEEFLSQLRASLREEDFIKLTLGKPRGPDATLRNVFVRLVSIGGQPHLSFAWHHERRDITKNHPPDAAINLIGGLLGTDFYSAHLFTTTRTVQLEFNKKGEPHLTQGKAVASVPDPGHDRVKTRLLTASSQPWLHALGVTTSTGSVRQGMTDKHRQIHKFVEILSHLAADAPLPAHRPIELADMGCGKGYLTFAACDYFNLIASRPARVRGVEVREELVQLCNRVVRETGREQLNFLHGTIASASFPVLDVLIALHACDTATDDAIVKGVQAGAALIVVAPCCQQELRPQLQAAPMLAPALRHGIFQERQAEFATDALRALLLEWAGYDTKVFEFIATEHTAKNLMIAATRRSGPARTEEAAAKVRALAEFYGIRSQALARQFYFDLGP
jgi:hypothetical protein